MVLLSLIGVQAQHCSAVEAYLGDEQVEGTPLAENRGAAEALVAADESQHPVSLLRMQPQGMEQAQRVAGRLHRCEGLAKILCFLQANEGLTPGCQHGLDKGRWAVQSSSE